ncbi:MAG: tRNA (adenosine(37)-N6)-threonylcarbamoyltransferase complex ATPase subunit type 1 TsaE [Lysobacterales bacterium]|jgi:tRNA threonylcarbamoyladenosine biosynthesis protein TsaE
MNEIVAETAPGCRPAWQATVPDEQAVQTLASRFARKLEPPLVIYLRGDLGAGKTTFARAYIHALGFSGYVKSPSYGLLETYEAGGQRVLHLDLYRIEDPEELEFLALRDLFTDDTVLLVEWPERGGSVLPKADLVLNFGETDETRFIRCEVLTPRGDRFASDVLPDI